MGITRSRLHKRRVTGGKRMIHRKKRKYELGRIPANTKLVAGDKRVSEVRCRGGNRKFRALRLDSGSFSWGTETCAQKCRILDVVYNATSNDLIRTKTLVKGAIVQIDAAPFRQWYEKHYGIKLVKAKRKGGAAAKGGKKGDKKDEKTESKSALRRWAKRAKNRKLEKPLADAIRSGKLLARISSRPGQVGRADGYLLEGHELAFYVKKTDKKKSKK
eukprot:TRINITY_DN1538_c0_g2_i3.p2 TRINITY_DN1538_c0_g2~~TRINITY_DN1538_c0_g2_i3.p2  ORF type:complete len:217 (+),score=101.86 TRINITY_DN1538_c0_g2_i3:85-735(+)